MGANILVIEESPDLCRLFEYLLRTAGYNVRTIHDSAAAPDALAGTAPDLIIFDWALDNTAGYQWLEAQHHGPLGGAVPLLFICGDPPSRIWRERLAGIGAALIEKPFDIHSLCRQVALLLGKRERAFGGA